MGGGDEDARIGDDDDSGDGRVGWNDRSLKIGYGMTENIVRCDAACYVGEELTLVD